MELLRYLTLLLIMGCALSTPHGEDQTKVDADADDATSPPQVPGDHENKKDTDKRLFGNVLSSGFKLGKKESSSAGGPPRMALKQDFKKWYYGTILGKGLKSLDGEFGKENLGQQGIFSGKRDMDSIDADLDAVDLMGPIDDKRWLGNVWGTYPVRRTKRDTLDNGFINYFGRDIVLPPKQNRHESEEEDYDLNSLIPYLEEAERMRESKGPSDRDDDIKEQKRYFLTNPGHRFDFGKRSDRFPDEPYLVDEDEGSPVEKRFFGHVLGRGFAFGKRRYRKRPFGYLLGKGFSFGKRTSEDSLDKRSGTETPDASDLADNDDYLDMDKRYGWLLGRGFHFGKRGNKRFGWILGRGLKFGKRSDMMTPIEGDYFIDDQGHIESFDDQMDEKRFGHVLGSGYAFGKREHGEEPHSEHDKRGFGFVLGRGFRLGKR